ncbi:MAG: hypothetical protein ACXWIU_14590, partial [Limisphaerales bacterium]
MARATKLWILLIALSFPFVASAQLHFTTNNGVITITGYSITNKNVTVPSVINGYSVATIGNNAFYFSGVTNVLLPNT